MLFLQFTSHAGGAYRLFRVARFFYSVFEINIQMRFIVSLSNIVRTTGVHKYSLYYTSDVILY